MLESNLPAAVLSLAGLSTRDGWSCPPFHSSVVVNGVLGMVGPAVMLIDGTEVLLLRISPVVVIRH